MAASDTGWSTLIGWGIAILFLIFFFAILYSGEGKGLFSKAVNGLLNIFSRIMPLEKQPDATSAPALSPEVISARESIRGLFGSTSAKSEGCLVQIDASKLDSYQLEILSSPSGSYFTLLQPFQKGVVRHTSELLPSIRTCRVDPQSLYTCFFEKQDCTTPTFTNQQVYTITKDSTAYLTNRKTEGVCFIPQSSFLFGCKADANGIDKSCITQLIEQKKLTLC
jgi:hypothetical protein